MLWIKDYGRKLQRACANLRRKLGKRPPCFQDDIATDR